MVYFKVKRGPVGPVYNDGIVSFMEKETLKDKFGTPIHRFKETLVYEDWFRQLGVTAQDVYYAHADDQTLNTKIAIRGRVIIDIKWSAYIDNKRYEVYRIFYSHRNNETEISLVEVEHD